MTLALTQTQTLDSSRAAAPSLPLHPRTSAQPRNLSILFAQVQWANAQQLRHAGRQNTAPTPSGSHRSALPGALPGAHPSAHLSTYLRAHSPALTVARSPDIALGGLGARRAPSEAYTRAAPVAGQTRVVINADGERVSLAFREQEVLQLVAKGFTVAQTAGVMGVSHHTVSTYVRGIYRKLAISCRAEATAEAARLGLVSF